MRRSEDGRKLRRQVEILLMKKYDLPRDVAQWILCAAFPPEYQFDRVIGNGLDGNKIPPVRRVPWDNTFFHKRITNDANKIILGDLKAAHLAISGDDRLAVVCRESSTVHVYDLGCPDEDPLLLGDPASMPPRLRTRSKSLTLNPVKVAGMPCSRGGMAYAGVAFDGAGDLYVTNNDYSLPYKIQVYDRHGEHRRSLGRNGSRLEEYEHPPRERMLFCNASALAFTNKGQLVVADYSNSRLQVVNVDKLQVVGSTGRWGKGPGAFHHASAVCVGNDGRIIAGDDRLQRVTVFTPELAVDFCIVGGGDSVAVNTLGEIAVSNTMKGTVSIYSHTGTVQQVLTLPGGCRGVAFDRIDRLFVSCAGYVMQLSRLFFRL
jgi:DNA-binding beta-propeller fold protein YncE